MLLIRDVHSAGPEKAAEIIEAAGLRTVYRLDSPEKWLHFFFPEPSRPVYLLFYDTMMEHNAWFIAGRWDVKSRSADRNVFYLPFFDLKAKVGGIEGSKGLDVDMKSGTLVTDAFDEPIKLKSVHYYGENDPKIVLFGRETGWSLEIFVPKRYAVLCGPREKASLFHRLFVRHEWNPDYFRPVSIANESYQLWEVRGDRIGSDAPP